jgi:hypothetical protein
VSVLEEVPVQRPDRVAAGECRIGSIGVGAGLLGVQGDHRFEVRVDALDASEVSIYNLSGRALSVSNRASEGGCRLGRQRARLAVHSEGDVRGRRSVAPVDADEQERDGVPAADVHTVL